MFFIKKFVTSHSNSLRHLLCHSLLRSVILFGPSRPSRWEGHHRTKPICLSSYFYTSKPYGVVPSKAPLERATIAQTSLLNIVLLLKLALCVNGLLYRRRSGGGQNVPLSTAPTTIFYIL